MLPETLDECTAHVIDGRYLFVTGMPIDRPRIAEQEQLATQQLAAADSPTNPNVAVDAVVLKRRDIDAHEALTPVSYILDLEHEPQQTATWIHYDDIEETRHGLHTAIMHWHTTPPTPPTPTSPYVT
jgi:hypothetical protein